MDKEEQVTALAVASVANDVVVVVERLERVRRVPSLKTTKISTSVETSCEVIRPD